MKYKNNFFIYIIIIYLSINNSFAKLTASVDRTHINQQDSIVLTVHSDQSNSSALNLNPLLKNFEIINSSKSSSLKIINGNRSYDEYWTIELFAKRTGKVIIPKLSIGNEKSNIIQLTVHSSDQYTKKSNQDYNNDNIILKSSVNNGIPYLHQQIVYTLKIMIKNNSGVEEVMLNPADITNASMKDLGDYTQYQTTFNNQTYQVYEKNIAIIPNQTGPLKISGFYVSGKKQIANNRQRNNDPFSLFFNEFSGRGKNTKQFKKIVPTITLEVQKPIKNIKPWLAAEKIKLNEKINQNSILNQGEPITRQVTITAIGTTAEQLPNILEDKLKNTKVYHDPPKFNNIYKNNTVIGTRIDTISYIPKNKGSFKLKPLKLEWWNTKKHKKMITASKQHEFFIQALLDVSAKPKQTINKNNANTLKSIPPTLNRHKEKTSHANNILFIILALSGWLAAFILYKPTKKLSKKKSTRLPNVNHQLKKLKSFASQDDYKNTALCLIKIIRINNPNINIQDLSDIIIKFDLPQSVKLEINKLQRVCYSYKKGDWSGNEFYSVISKAIRSKHLVFKMKKSIKNNHTDDLHLIS